MARADRLERLDAERLAAEAAYETALVEAVHRAAAGLWGLFGHTQDRARVAKWQPTVTDLCDRGQDIARMRETLGLAPFALHQEFEASRGPVPANAPGEPKQARAWLERLGKSV